jgi:tetratricopeptide (TPR) repeat protein
MRRLPALVATAVFVCVSAAQAERHTPLGDCSDSQLSGAKRLAACAKALADTGLNDKERSLVLALQARARRENGDPGGALKDLDESLKLWPDNDQAYFEKGAAHDERMEFSEAMSAFTHYQALRPQKAWRAFYGNCWFRARTGKDLEIALNDCEAAIQLRADYAGSYDSRGLVLLRLSRFREALLDFDDALKLSPKLPSALFLRGVTKRRLGDAAAGDADIAAAQALSSDIGPFYAKYGIVP